MKVSKLFLKIPKDAKLYLDGLNEVEYDIFSTIDNPGHIFVSERFVEACKTEKITNILRLVEGVRLLGFNANKLINSEGSSINFFKKSSVTVV